MPTWHSGTPLLSCNGQVNHGNSPASTAPLLWINLLAAVSEHPTRATYRRVHFGSQIAGTVHHGRKAQEEEHEVAGHVLSAVRKLRGECWRSTHLLLNPGAHSPLDVPAHIQGESFLFS